MVLSGITVSVDSISGAALSFKFSIYLVGPSQVRVLKRDVCSRGILSFFYCEDTQVAEL